VIGLVKLYAVALLALSLVAGCLWMYWREGVREEAALRWEADRPPLPRETFQKVEWQARQPAAIRRLAVWAYAAPLLAITAAIWLLNEG
jgi:hypothetical protein